MKYLEDMLVEITVSDPWEWGTEVGVTPLSAKILRWRIGEDYRPTEILLSLLKTVMYKGVECRFFVGTPALEREHLEDIARGLAVECALTQIPEDRARSSDPFDLSWWRGGIGLTCTIRAKLV